MFKTLKETMFKELEESMGAMFYQIENINEKIEIIKNNQIEYLEVKSYNWNEKNSHVVLSRRFGVAEERMK